MSRGRRARAFGLRLRRQQEPHRPVVAAAATTAARTTVTGTVSSFGIVQHEVSIVRLGTMTLTLTWTAGPDLDLYLTAPSCNGYPPTACQILAASDGLSMPETIRRTVNAGETFKAWVDSFAAASVSYTLSLRVE